MTAIRIQRTLSGLVPSAVVIVAVAILMAVLFAGANRWSYDSWAGAVVGMVLLLGTLPLVLRLARREPDHVVGRIIVAAFVLKLAASVVRFLVLNQVYDGVGDAQVYHDYGAIVAESFRSGNFEVDVDRELVSTGFVRWFTGLVYTVTGPTMAGGFFVFSWLGFWGLYLFHRAFAIACPEGDRRRYALLVFLLPSLLFWPSSIGKEALMMLSLGVLAYGAARILARRRHGIPVVLLGAAMAALVRPHVAFIALLALFLAYLLRRRPEGASILAPLAKLGGIVLLGLALVLVVNEASGLFGEDEFSVTALTEARERAVGQTANAGAGSTFEASTQNDLNPSQFHLAVVNVLFRPYPWEARNAQAVIAALEAFTLLVLFVVGWRRLLGGIRSALRTPYVVFVSVYSILFIYGFSAFSNFGILTRQRVQLLPFVVVLLALPPLRRDRTGWREILGVAPAGRDAGHETSPNVVDRPMYRHAESR